MSPLTRRGGASCGLAAVSVAAALGPTSPRAWAGESTQRNECVESAEQGQQLRDDGKYRQAREAFARCARDGCPTMVQHDCALWLVDLEQRSATIVVSARDDQGNDLVDVKVSLDGADLAAKLDGKPIPVDPGEHSLHAEAPGLLPVEKHVVIRASEKNRVLSLDFVRPAPAAPPPPSSPSETAGTSHSGGVPASVWIFGGVAAAAFASEAFFGISGVSQRAADLNPNGCAPHCSSSEKSSIQTKFLVADVSLGVGLVSAGLAAYFLFRPRERSVQPAASIDFVPQPGGGFARLESRF